VLGPLVTEFILNSLREGATPIQRVLQSGLLYRIEAAKLTIVAKGGSLGDIWRGQARIARIIGGGWACPLRQLQETHAGCRGCFRIYRPSSMPSFGLGRCDRRHKLLFEYPIIFWTPRGSLCVGRFRATRTRTPLVQCV
jgi:hypothetical protein